MYNELKYIKTVFVVLAMLCCFTSCQKIVTYPKADIVAGSIYIKEAGAADTVTYDTNGIDTVSAKFEAAIADQPSAYNATVTFKIDPSKMPGYTSEYKGGVLLPANMYKAIKMTCNMPAGSPQSESAQIQIIGLSKIAIGSVYVLPIVITSVNGSTTLMRQGQVLYLVFTKPADPKTFKIVSSTSDDGYNKAVNILAGDPKVFWQTAPYYYPTPPQTVVVDMVTAMTVSAITYYNGPDNPAYSTPLQLQLLLSTDGVTWTDEGTYAGSTGTGVQTLAFKRTTARYFKLTILQVQSYYNFVWFAEIGDIGVVN